jgi:hypothetical protein
MESGSSHFIVIREESASEGVEFIEVLAFQVEQVSLLVEYVLSLFELV